MALRSVRRRIRQRMAGHDWLEGFLTAIGLVFFALSASCVYATVDLIAHFRDQESGFPAGTGFVTGMKGFGLVFFPVLGLVSFSVGKSFAGDRLIAWTRQHLRKRRG